MSKVILTADDSVSVRQMVAMSLKRAGYDILEAKDGQDALNQLQKNKIDLLITDLNMPNLNGFELIRRVRAISRYQYVPIIVLTTESTADKKQAGKVAGATGWIVKPFKPAQLTAVVKKVIR